MKLFVVGFALLAAACAVAVVPSTEYLPPVQELSEVEPLISGVSGGLTDDGYRYKTVRRFRVRRRRDVNELPSNEYLPPIQQQVSLPQQVSIPQVSVSQSLPVQQYSSVSSVGVPSNEYLAPIASAGPVSQISSGVLADDGYRYRTVKRYRLRHRRDVSELPSNEYLPPVQQQVSLPQVSVSQSLPVQQYSSVSNIGVPSNEYLAPIASAGPVSQVSSGVLADDGYRYRTVKRYRLRHRRDVSELPSNEYLPPVQQQVSVSQVSVPQVSISQQLPVQQYSSVSSIGVPSNEYLAPIAPAGPVAQISSGVLADDGYRYRTVKRYRLRHRRDVSELPSSEYLPPVQQQVSLPQISLPQVSISQQLPVQQYSSVSSIGVPSNEYLAPIGSAGPVSSISSGVLADDGYRYRTVKRFRARHRRAVSALPSVEYLPPVSQQIALPQLPIQQISAIPSTQYLAPIDIAPVTSNLLSGVLSDDGYRYKTVKKIKRRH